MMEEEEEEEACLADDVFLRPANCLQPADPQRGRPLWDTVEVAVVWNMMEKK